MDVQIERDGVGRFTILEPLSDAEKRFVREFVGQIFSNKNDEEADAIVAGCADLNYNVQNAISDGVLDGTANGKLSPSQMAAHGRIRDAVLRRTEEEMKDE